MNPSSLDTINFCLKFIKDNFDEASQRTMCRTWLKTAIETLNSEDLGSVDFITSELNAIDQYLSGASSTMTPVDVITKLDTVNQLLG
ncbi:MAG: hypothetical protein JEZ08_02345 [Clostridiales bacterium]|nr:hypothetical protein [Clostridiales bacterium]